MGMRDNRILQQGPNLGSATVPGPSLRLFRGGFADDAPEGGVTTQPLDNSSELSRILWIGRHETVDTVVQ